MKKIDKKAASLFVIALCFIIGGSLSFESMARFTQKFDASKTVSSAKFDIEAIRDFENVVDVMPGDVIGEDKITLTNNNNYPVEFTIKLKSENDKSLDKDLLSFLTLSIFIDNEIQELKEQYVIILNAGEKKEIISKVEWPIGEDEYIDADIASEATVVYSYDIKAKQISKDDSNSGGNGNGGEGNGGTNPDEGNNGNENDNNTPNTDVKTITLKDVIFKASNIANQGKIEVKDTYTLVGTNSNAVLENLKFDLKNEKLVFNADIELLNNNTEGKGLNFAIGVKESNESDRNRLTYQLYKAKEVNNENIYAKVTNVINPLPPNEISREGNGGSIIETLKVKLSGEITKNGDFIYSKFLMTDERGNIVSSGEEPIKCGEYKDTDKLYINISSIMGKEGININSMEVKAVPNH